MDRVQKLSNPNIRTLVFDWFHYGLCIA